MLRNPEGVPECNCRLFLKQLSVLLIFNIKSRGNIHPVAAYFQFLAELYKVAFDRRIACFRIGVPRC